MTMSIVFAGTPENAAVTLRELVVAGVEISLVITRPDAPVGRKRVLTPSQVALVAEELGLPLVKATKLGELEIERIKDSGAQLGIVVAYGALLKAASLAALPLGWYNVHYSLLPKWRGAAPVQHALLAGDVDTGVSLFKIDEGLDTGPLVAQVPTQIEPMENAGELLRRLTGLGVSMVLQELPRLLAGFAELTEQSDRQTAHAAKPTREDARLLPSDSAEKFLRKVRAFNPEPGAWLMWNGQPFKVLEAVAWPETNITLFKAELIDSAVVVGTDSGALRLVTVQPAGKSPMKAVDWFRGTNPNARTFE